MVRPAWVSACALDAPDESEAKLTALDLAARPPAKLGMLRCLLACGATPTARVVLALVRNPPQAATTDDSSTGGDIGGGGDAGSRSGGGGENAVGRVRECLLGAVTASEGESNPLIPGMNLSVALTEATLQVICFRLNHFFLTTILGYG